MAKSVIITCAVTGSIHTPTMSEHLPITPNEIAEGAIAASEAGASILHLHARNPDGSPNGRFSAANATKFLPSVSERARACHSPNESAKIGGSFTVIPLKVSITFR